MNRREPSVFSSGPSPDEASLWSVVWAVLAGLAILFVLYKSFLWWDLQRQPQPVPQATVGAPLDGTTPRAPVALPPQTNNYPDRLVLESDPSTTAKRTVRKCLVQGHVSYTDRPCPNGGTTSSVTVSTANVGTVAPTAPPEPAVQITQQVVGQQAPAMQTQGTDATKQVECDYLEMEIKRIDAAARQPQSGQTQDALAEQRKKVRSRQFALHC
jgi:hypothetical protein